MDEREEKIRERAFRIWEEEGRPHGRHAEHWRRAESEVAEERVRTHATHGRPMAPDAAAPGAAPTMPARPQRGKKPPRRNGPDGGKPPSSKRTSP